MAWMRNYILRNQWDLIMYACLKFNGGFVNLPFKWQLPPARRPFRTKQCMWLHTHGFISVNTLRPWQNGSHLADDIFKYIFLNENVLISIAISLNFVPERHINNIPALVQIMAWCRPGDKPLSEPVMVSLMTHICVTRPQWLKAMEGNFTIQLIVIT